MIVIELRWIDLLSVVLVAIAWVLTMAIGYWWESRK